MHILYLCTFYQRAMIFRDAMNHLEARGHDVLAFNAVAKGTKIDEKYRHIMDEKVIHRECFTKYDRACFPLKQAKFRRSLEQNVDVTKFDVMHSHTLFNGGWVAYKMHRKYGVPYVVSVRNTDLNTFLRVPGFKRVAVKIAEDASGILFLSEAYRIRFLELCFKESDRSRIREKSAVIPNGLEPFWLENIYQPKDKVHKPLELLFVGRIDKNKNIPTILKALDHLNAEGVHTHLTVIGQMVYHSAKTLLESNHHVTVIPFIKKEELVDRYRKADIFVMPSFHESFGRVYIEAMTQGVPVIYTRGEGFDKAFPEGTVGYSVKPDSAEEIADSVKKIADHYAQISGNCIDNCRRYDWMTITEELESLYSKAAAKPD